MGMIHIEETYEPLHFASMREHLKPGMITYDIGAYDGITSAIIARIVGPENTVIIEPAETNWATIRAYWQKRFDPIEPRATYAGFIGERYFPGRDQEVWINGWPSLTDKQKVSDAEEYSHFRSLTNTEEKAILPIDMLRLMAGTPAAMTMDVEGAELLVLRGARQTLVEHHPLVWVSIHPQLMGPLFHTEPAELHSFMREIGYKESLIYTDHEEHWLFR